MLHVENCGGLNIDQHVGFYFAAQCFLTSSESTVAGKLEALYRHCTWYFLRAHSLFKGLVRLIMQKSQSPIDTNQRDFVLLTVNTS